MVRRSDKNETLAITQAAEGNITVRSANSLTASKNAKLDHQLTYVKFTFAKNHFLTAIESAKWGSRWWTPLTGFSTTLTLTPYERRETKVSVRCCIMPPEYGLTSMAN